MAATSTNLSTASLLTADQDTRTPWRRLSQSRTFWAWLFCFPAIAVVLMVAGYPLLRTIYLSLTDANLARLDDIHWVGLENYYFLLQDPDWWRAVANTIVFAMASVSIETVLGMVIALILNSQFKGRGMVRAGMLIPWAIPTVVSAKMWAWMLNDQYGIVNDMLFGLGLIDHKIAWLANDQLAMLTVVAVDVWKTTPFMALLLLAGLQSIPKNIYEAAEIDASHPIQTFFQITLPMMIPALLVGVIFRTLDALRIFDLVYILTSNSRATAVMSVYARQQMVDFQDFGYGSAASCLIFGLVAMISVVYLTAGRKYLGVKV